MTQTPKRRPRRTRKPKTKVEDLPEESQQYLGNTEPYAPPEHMVPLDDERYMKKDKVGTKKEVKIDEKVTRIGLGNLKVIHSNPINYYGDIDVQS